MKLSKKILQVLAALFLSISIIGNVPIYASNCSAYKGRIEPKQQEGKIKVKAKDMIKLLESKKEKIALLEKEGKISKEKADKIINRLDMKIKMITELENLPLDKKKERLADNFKEHMDKRLAKGKITKDKVEELIKEFNKKLENWNGEDYIWFHHNGFECHRHHCQKNH